MFKLHANSGLVSCEKAVKGIDYIHCYQNGKIIAEFNGISDFSGYALTDESDNPVEFAEPESDNTMDAAIRAVVMAMSENGALSGPLESIIDRAIEIAHDKED